MNSHRSLTVADRQLPTALCLWRSASFLASRRVRHALVVIGVARRFCDHRVTTPCREGRSGGFARDRNPWRPAGFAARPSRCCSVRSRIERRRPAHQTTPRSSSQGRPLRATGSVRCSTGTGRAGDGASGRSPSRARAGSPRRSRRPAASMPVLRSDIDQDGQRPPIPKESSRSRWDRRDTHALRQPIHCHPSPDFRRSRAHQRLTADTRTCPEAATSSARWRP